MGVTAKVVIRVTDEATGKRRWVLATGKKTDPPGPFYTRHCVGSSPRYEYAGDRFDVALAAKVKLERRLKAASVGAVVVKEVAAPPAQTRHRIADVVEAYIAQESKPDKNGDVRPQKSLHSIRSEVTALIKWSRKTYVDELTRETLKGYRDWLLTEGKGGKPYEPDSCYNKLMVCTTFLKNNSVCPLEKPLLPVSEFPDKKDTQPDPYTLEEFDRFMACADYETALLFYFLICSGMRNMEAANSERGDINFELGEISVVKKRHRNFLGKTPTALRDVPLPADLLAELKLLPEGLLFPAPEGGVDTHLLNRIERVAKLAGITPTSEKSHMKAKGMVKDDWVHRTRDTAITNQLELSCKSMADMLRLIKRVGHSDGKTLEKYFGRLAKPYVPKFPERHRRAKVVVKGASAA